MEITDNLLRRLAHGVADFKEASQGVRAKEFRSYLDGLRDAVSASGGPADFTLLMYDAFGHCGNRPSLGAAHTNELKAWEALMIETYRNGGLRLPHLLRSFRGLLLELAANDGEFDRNEVW